MTSLRVLHVDDEPDIAHSLAGAGGIFGFPAISEKSATLVRAADAMIEGCGGASEVARSLDDLLRQIAQE